MTEDEATIINLAKVIASQAGDMIFHQHTEARFEALVQSLHGEKAALTERAEKAETRAKLHLEETVRLRAQLGRVQNIVKSVELELRRVGPSNGQSPLDSLHERINNASALAQTAYNEAGVRDER